MQNTTNYGLRKPDGIDTVDIGDFNYNADQIDSALTPTADPTQAPTGNAGKLVQWVGWIANRIKAITGKPNWYDAPDTTLAVAKTHIDATAPHTGHETPSGAQAKADVAAASGIAAASTVQGNLASHVADNAKHGVMHDPTLNVNYVFKVDNGLLYIEEVA